MNLNGLSTAFKHFGISHDAGVLAGGRALRMGGKDKGLIELHDSALISASIGLLRPLAKDHKVLINCNREHENYLKLSSRICSDRYPEFPGPLAGLHAILDESDADLVFIMPCDTPFVTEELIKVLGLRALELLRAGRTLKPIGIKCEQFKHPLHCCLPKTSLPSISDAIQQGKHKLIRWFDDNEAEWVTVDDSLSLTNINTPLELERATQQMLKT